MLVNNNIHKSTISDKTVWTKIAKERTFAT